MKNVPVQVIFIGKIFYSSTENNEIFRVTVECLLSSGIKTHGRRMFSFIDLFPPYFIKLCLNIHPKIPLKCDFSIWAGPNLLTFWSANFQIKLAPLILYTTLVGIPMGTNCAPLLADLFLYSYESDFFKSL